MKKKNETNSFDFDAYMHVIMDEIEDSYWLNDSEFTITMKNKHVLRNQSVKDALIASLYMAISGNVPVTLELSGVRDNQLMFHINDLGKAKKQLLFDMFRSPNFKNLPSTFYYNIDWDMKYLIIVDGEGEIFAEMTNIEPNEEQEVLDFSYKLISKGYNLFGGYDLLKIEYEKTGTINCCIDHNITICTF